MKNKTIIGIGMAGLICSIAGGYYYWVALQVAVLLAGSQGDNSLNVYASFWFATLCIGVTLLLTSGISVFASRRRKSGLSAA